MARSLMVSEVLSAFRWDAMVWIPAYVGSGGREGECFFAILAILDLFFTRIVVCL